MGFVHLFLPGPTDATTPVLGFPGEGLDVEPSTMTDYKGFTAFAVLAGEAKASDGNTYPVEMDIRVMEGTYVAEDGSTNRGAFAFIWLDLIDPGAGSQIVDMQPGTQQNGLFWTTEIPRPSFSFKRNGSSARLQLKGQPLVDTIFFGNPRNCLSAAADIDVTWKASGKPVERGSGNSVPADDPAAFSGVFRDARATGTATAARTGFSFETNRMTADGFYAVIGEEKNGAWL